METYSKAIWRDNRGFTLVELMVVIAIAGILMAIAVPAYTKSHESAASRAHEANVRTLEGAALAAIATEGLPDGEIIWNREVFSGANEGDENQKYNPRDYIKDWPDVPKGAGNIEGDINTGYIVTISKDGTIKIEPGVAKRDVGKAT